MSTGPANRDSDSDESPDQPGPPRRAPHDTTLVTLVRETLASLRQAKITAYESRDIPDTLDQLDDTEEKIQQIRRRLKDGEQAHGKPSREEGQ